MQFKHWLITEEIFEKGNQATVYHRTGKYGDNDVGSIEGILNYGFKIGGGRAYGPGLYTLVNLDEQLSGAMSSYGNHIIKMVVSNVKNYLITIPYYARKIYNDPSITLQKQIKSLGITIDDDQVLEKYNKNFNFENPTSPISYYSGDTASSFVNNYQLWQGRNCKGILYRDSHGLVLLLYPPFDGVMPLAWAKAPTNSTNPDQVVWHNIKNVARINFADANLDYTTTPKRISYRARSERSTTDLTAKEAIEMLNYIKDEKNYTANYYEYIEKFGKIAEFLNAKRIRIRTLFKNIPDAVAYNMRYHDFLKVLINTNNNNQEILDIIKRKNLPSYVIDQIYATCPNRTNAVNELRKELLSLDNYNPDIEKINDHIDTSHETINDVIEFLIEESRAISKTLDLSYLSTISPVMYFKEMARQGTLDEKALNRTIDNIYKLDDMEAFLKLIKEQQFSDFDVYQKIIGQYMKKGLSLKNMVAEIPELEIEKYFKSPANKEKIDAILRSGYRQLDSGESQNTLFYDMFFKYVTDPTDKQLAYMLSKGSNQYTSDEFEKTLDMIIKFRKTKNQFLSKDELIEVIQAAKKFSKESIMDIIPDENWEALDNAGIRSLVYKFNTNTKFITKLADKFLNFNKNLDAETKQYFEEVIKDPKNANKYIMIPSYKEISDIAAERVQNDSYYFKAILSSVLQTMGNASLPPEKMAVLQKNIYDFAIERMNTDKPTEAMIDRVLHYLESEIPSDLDPENFIKNIPINILEKIFIDADYMLRLQKMLYKLKTQNNLNLSNVFDHIKNNISSNPNALKLFNVFLRQYRTGAYHY